MSIFTKPESKAVGAACTGDRVSFTLEDGREISAPLSWFPRLVNATEQQRRNWEIIGSGIGVHWPDVDEDISVAVLLGHDCV